MRADKELGKKIGHATRFNGETAAKAAEKSVRAHRVKKCMRDIARAALYQKPPLGDEQMKTVAKYYNCSVEELTIAEVALFKQVAEALKGDRAALEMLATYAGEKPSEKVEITTMDYTDLDAAFNAMQAGGGGEIGRAHV